MAETDAEPAVSEEDLQRTRERLAETVAAAADANSELAGTHPRLAAHDLERTHARLLDLYQATAKAIQQTERLLDTLDQETPRRIIDEHADRLEETYDGRTCDVALLLATHNRQQWLWRKPDTVGADEVRRHGLTQTQRSILTDLTEATDE